MPLDIVAEGHPATRATSASVRAISAALVSARIVVGRIVAPTTIQRDLRTAGNRRRTAAARHSTLAGLLVNRACGGATSTGGVGSTASPSAGQAAPACLTTSVAGNAIARVCYVRIILPSDGTANAGDTRRCVERLDGEIRQIQLQLFHGISPRIG